MEYFFARIKSNFDASFRTGGKVSKFFFVNFSFYFQGMLTKFILKMFIFNFIFCFWFSLQYWLRQTLKWKTILTKSTYFMYDLKI